MFVFVHIVFIPIQYHPLFTNLSTHPPWILLEAVGSYPKKSPLPSHWVTPIRFEIT